MRITMNKMIPIGLFSTLLLTACGGGSSGGGGGGGGSTPEPTKYTWQFVQMKANTQQNMLSSCAGKAPTEFYVDTSDIDESKWVYTFAVQAPNITDILVYDANSVLYTDTNLSKFDINPTTATLTFSENDIPDGGYVTIVDSIKDGSKHLLTVQKELLSDALIKVNVEQGTQKCYAENKLVKNAKNKKVIIGTFDGVAESSVEGFLTGQSQKGTGTTKTEIETLNNEYVLLSGFNASNQITGFSYQASSALSDMTSTSTTPHALEALTSFMNIDLRDSSDFSFLDMTIFSNYKGQVFTWNSWATKPSIFTSYAKLGDEFNYSATYEGTLNSWKITANSTASATGDISIELDSLDMQTTPAPAFECGGSTCYVNVNALTSLDVDTIKLEYTAGVTRHTIYTNDRDMFIPEIPSYIEDVTYPDSLTPVNVSFLMGDNITNEARSGFMSYSNIKENPPRDEYIDMLIAPGLEMKHQLGVKQSTFISVVSP